MTGERHGSGSRRTGLFQRNVFATMVILGLSARELNRRDLQFRRGCGVNDTTGLENVDSVVISKSNIYITNFRQG
jgi:hypothetical protein